MAGKLINEVRATVTAATAAGYLTVSSATGLYVNAYGWLTLTAGGSQVRVQITSISGTTVGVKLVGNVPNYGRSDVSAYNAGGYLNQEAQLIYNPNDKPLD